MKYEPKEIGSIMAAALATPLRQGPAGPSITAPSMAGRLNLIAASPLFTGLSQHANEEIALQARPRTFARGEMLFMQGEPARSVALIRTGSVKITQLAPIGNEVILWMYGSGNVLGALSEPTFSRYTCSARAIEQGTALVWDFAALQSLMLKYPQIRRNASLILATRLNELEERFREVATEKVAKRVSLALLRLLKHVGKEVDGGVEVSLSREELAQMTGTTLFTISRLFSKWSEMGLVSPRREAVLVRDARQLEMAEDDDCEKGTCLVRGKRDPRHPEPPVGIFGLALANDRSRKASEMLC